MGRGERENRVTFPVSNKDIIIRHWTLGLVYVFAQPQRVQRNVGNLG